MNAWARISPASEVHSACFRKSGLPSGASFIVRLGLLGMLAGILAACANGDQSISDSVSAIAAPPLDDPALGSVEQVLAYVARADSARSVLTQRSGIWEMGDATGRYVAWVIGDSARAVIDSVDQAEYGRSVNRYYFARGALVFYASDGVLTNTGPGAASPTRAQHVAVAFDSSGAVIDARKTVDGASAPLEAWVVPGAKNQAAKLRVDIATRPR